MKVRNIKLIYKIIRSQYYLQLHKQLYRLPINIFPRKKTTEINLNYVKLKQKIQINELKFILLIIIYFIRSK